MKCPNCGCSLPEDSEFCQYCGIKLENAPINEDVTAEPSVTPVVGTIKTESTSDATVPQDVSSEIIVTEAPSEAAQEETLFLRAYKSYLSKVSEEKQFFENLRGSAELRTAYLKECDRNKKDRDNGVHVSYKQSYIDFMGILHNEYFGLPMAAVRTPQVLEEIHNEEPTASNNKAKQKKSRQRYCKLCGQAIDSTTKKCTGCGKQYFKAKFKTLYAVLVVLVLLGGYIGINYFCAVSSMNNQEFIKAQQFFDNLLVSETLFSEKYDYVAAGVLMEEGEYIAALNAFNKADGVPVPASITDSLKSKIYSAGQASYKAGNLTEAKKYFYALSGYKRSADYRLLINCNGSSLIAKTHYNKLVKLLGFEDADEIILKHESTAEPFLEGRWEDGDTYPYYFEMYENDEGNLSCIYNLPRKDSSGYYYLSDGVYSVGETESTAVKYYKFSIINEDTISVYCYKDGSTHKLYRQ